MIRIIDISKLVSFSLQGTPLEAIELKPLYEPQDVSFAFETIGWPILGFILLIISAVFGYKWFKNYRRNAYKRTALKTILSLENLNHLNMVLKQVAMITYGRKEVASLYGKDWFSFLESKGKNTPFKSYQDLFFKEQYKEKIVAKNDFKNVKDISIRWIKTHA